MSELSRNPNITWDIIKNNPQGFDNHYDAWSWYILSMNEFNRFKYCKYTTDIEFVE